MTKRYRLTPEQAYGLVYVAGSGGRKYHDNRGIVEDAVLKKRTIEIAFSSRPGKRELCRLVIDRLYLVSLYPVRAWKYLAEHDIPPKEARS